ncbi:MAG: hypothetical protein L0Y54_01880 [Sporichthyaceae bacterium]|nr:hypothetical protein [Sporichthyaceae bacterium]
MDSAVLAAINVQRAQWAIMAAGDLQAVRYRDYVTGEAEKTVFKDFVGQYVDGGVGATGTDRLFDFEITDVTSDSATVVFCDDQTDLHPTRLATGETLRPTPAVPAFWRETRSVVLTDGRWKVSAVVSEGDVPACDFDA